MKLLAVIGGVSGFYLAFIQIIYLRLLYYDVPNLLTQIFSLNGFLGLFLGMFIATLTIVIVFRPNNPLPWHWLVLLLFGVLIMILSHILSGICVLVAGIIGWWKKV